jgi:hypothetical protein
MYAARLVSIACLIISVIAVQAQTVGVEGRYQGSADIQGIGKVDISADIRHIDGKLSGVVHSQLGDAEIIGGGFNDGIINITIDAGGDDVVLKGKVLADGSVNGEISSETLIGTFQLHRVADLPAESNSPVIHQSKNKWRQDLSFLASELPKRHKNLFHRISKAEWEDLLGGLDKQIPLLSDEEIVLSMGRIVSRVGDGHTWLAWPRVFPRIPVKLFWFGHELRIVQVSKDYPQLSGAQITKINGRNVNELYQLSREYISPGESEEFVLNTNPYLITFPVFLKQLGAGGPNETVRLDLIDIRGKRSSISIPAIQNEADVEWIQACDSHLLYLQKPELPLYFEYLKDHNAIYVNFRSYPRRAEFKKFSNELFDFIDKNSVDKLIFDLRQNGGGDFTRGREFFVEPLKKRAKFLERGHIFAITGRRTFSAGMTNAADLRNELNAILVGEPTGARPNGYQENRSFLLPNSHLSVSYSTELYKFSPVDTLGIIPDKLIAPTWTSCRDGRDDALEWALVYSGPDKK